MHGKRRKRKTTMNRKEEKKMKMISSSPEDLIPDILLRLPEDLITEILLRLPVKSLLRFKSVCKKWNSLITNPTFAKSHHQHYTTHYNLSSSYLVIRSNHSMFTLHLDLKDRLDNPIQEFNNGKFAPIAPAFNTTYKNDGIHVFGSSNGILCIYVRSTKNIYLWNPTINESRLIPSPISIHSQSLCKHSLCGFGFIPSINDYKIVLVLNYPNYKLQVHVYSLRKNEWRELDSSIVAKSMKIPTLNVHFHDISNTNTRSEGSRCSEAILLNDALYWAVCAHIHKQVTLTVKFDMVNESFETVAEHNQIHHIDGKEGRYLAETLLGVMEYNKLCLCQRYGGKEPLLVEMWVLDDQHQRWNKMFRLKGGWNNYNNFRKVFPKLMRITGNGGVLIFDDKRYEDLPMERSLIFDARQGRIGSFIQVRNEYCTPYNSRSSFEIVNYVQSLVSPNSILL